MLQLIQVSEISESLEVVEKILDLCVGDAADLGNGGVSGWRRLLVARFCGRSKQWLITNGTV